MKRAEFLRYAALLASSLGCRGRSSTSKKLASTRLPDGLGLAPAWELNGVIGTGQSLAVGAFGKPLRATSPAHNNLKLDLGSRFSLSAEPDYDDLALVPLCEPIRDLAWRYPGPYPRNVFGETLHTAMAHQVTALLLQASSGAGDYVAVHSVVGESGQGMRVIGKRTERTPDTGHAYAASLFETRAIARLAKAAGRSFGVAAVVLTHGESDAVEPGYADALLELARDYDLDLRAITGQSRAVPLLATQQSSCPTEPGGLARSALALLDASARAPELITCVGPKYQYSYVPDGVHLDAVGYDQLGEKYGQVYFERVVRGRAWQPLAPRAVTRSGNVIEISFHVPVPPLTWRDSPASAALAARPEWQNGRGFELSANDEPLTIEEVSLRDTSVRLRFAGEPRSPLVLRYALSAGPRARAAGCARFGALCDSDRFVGSLTGRSQPNYAVMFERVLS